MLGLAREHLTMDTEQIAVAGEPASLVSVELGDTESTDLTQFAEATAAELTEVAADMTLTTAVANEPVATQLVDKIETVSEPVEVAIEDDATSAVEEIKAEEPSPEPPSTPSVVASSPPATTTPDLALDPEMLEIER